LCTVACGNRTKECNQVITSSESKFAQIHAAQSSAEASISEIPDHARSIAAASEGLASDLRQLSVSDKDLKSAVDDYCIALDRLVKAHRLYADGVANRDPDAIDAGLSTAREEMEFEARAAGKINRVCGKEGM